MASELPFIGGAALLVPGAPGAVKSDMVLCAVSLVQETTRENEISATCDVVVRLMRQKTERKDEV